MNHRLWYTSPASEWKNGLPIGTGRLAGMVLGGIDVERIALNHEWLCVGQNKNRKNEDRSHIYPRLESFCQRGDMKKVHI